MAEQWPFKPLVERSSRSALTKIPLNKRGFALNWLARLMGVLFEPIRAHRNPSEMAGLPFNWLARPGGILFEPLRDYLSLTLP